MTTPTTTIDATGASAPPFSAVIGWLQDLYHSIFGEDAYIEPDSQDGQLIGGIASGINDCNQTALGVYNQMSPATSQGAGLSSVVKINGLQRLVASQSTVDVTLIGQAGTQILNGQIGDDQQLDTRWLLPATVRIPITGEITVTATCTSPGAVAAAADTITQILTPTRGWQTVNNALAATAGAPVEMDPTLRQRQSLSTNKQAQSPLSAIQGALTNLPGILRLKMYENDEGPVDSDGIRGHTIVAVIKGGDATTICQTIALKKMPGAGTQGTITQVVLDQNGVPVPISFYPLTDVPISINITIKALPGYVSTTGAQIVADVVAWINALPIGEDVYWSKLFGPAGLNNVALGNTFNVTMITVDRDGNPPATSDVVISFIEAASCDTSLVTLTVV